MRNGYAVVVGAVNVDIWGRSFKELIARDSNPGEIRFSLGGVGRNIAHNLRLLEVPVRMLTALGGDGWAEQIRDNCRKLGIDLDGSITIPEAHTSSYLFITGPGGDMELAVCDADIAKYIDAAFIQRNLDLLNGAELVVFDGNLTEETIDYLTRACRAPLFADPVSVTKARKLQPFLNRIHTIKPNRLEAETLTGEIDPVEAAKALVDRGVKHVFVSNGADGMIAADSRDLIRLPCYPARLVNATGGGDAAMAALARAYLDGSGMEHSARYALAAGAVTVESAETIAPSLCDAMIRNRMNQD